MSGDGDLRRVRRLRLRAGDAAQAGHARVLIEDALRCATLPAAGDDGRVVLVRRLDLGRLPGRASSQALALHIERRYAQALSAAVRVAAPRGGHDADAAAGAPAVWFRDALEAHAALGARLAAGTAPAAWYWPLAVPGYDPREAPAAGLRRVLGSLAARPEAPAALPAFVRALADAGGLDALAAALHERDVPALRAAAGPGAAAEGRPASVAALAPRAAAAAPAVRAFLADLLGRGAGAAVRRRDELSGPAAAAPAAPRPPAPPAAGDAAATPPGAAPSRRPQDAAPRADGAAAAGAAPPQTASRPRPAGGAAEAGDGARPPGAAGTSASAGVARGRPAGAAGGTPAAAAAPVCASATAPAPAPGQADADADADADAPCPTRAGGLLLLVRALDRLGYAAWAEAHAAGDRGAVARRVFALLLARLGVPADDPAWRLAGGAPRPLPAVAPAAAAAAGPATGTATATGREAAGAVHPGTGAAPSPLPPEEPPPAAAGGAAWRGLAERRAALGATRPARPAPPGMPALDALAAAWLGLVRRWLRRVAGIGPASLVLRPARLALTPTHADVCAGLDAVDLRVRRAGLDVDPGWVPWLGRVVAFRYDDRRRGAAPGARAGTGAAGDGRRRPGSVAGAAADAEGRP